MTSDRQKLPVNMVKFEVNGAKNVLLELTRPNTNWPVGNYELDIIMDNNVNAVVPFSIVR